MAFGCLMRSGRRAGTICQDKPNLSFSQPHCTSLPPRRASTSTHPLLAASRIEHTCVPARMFSRSGASRTRRLSAGFSPDSNAILAKARRGSDNSPRAQDFASHNPVSGQFPCCRQSGGYRAVAGIKKSSAVTSTCSASGGIESDLLNELPHFVPVGTRRFSSSVQFSTTLICVGAACSCSTGLIIRNRWPSGDTS